MSEARKKEKVNFRKLNLALIFGGRSAEHEVSIQSAKNIMAAIDKKKYKLILIGISRSGKWFLQKSIGIEVDESNQEVVFLHGRQGDLVALSGSKVKLHADVAFPILHGSNGEGGAVQGILQSADIPFVGAGVLGSAVGMDKDVMKRLLKEANLPVAKFVVFRKFQKNEIVFNKIKKEIGLPFFVKPANSGSSIGISMVKNEEEFYSAVSLAFSFDRKIIFEESIKGKEIECSVLGNDNPIVSACGEITSKYEFYSYKAKYVDKNGAIFDIPARIDKRTEKKIKELSVKAFKALECEGMARVDFFLTEKGEIYINEINTIPGFTKISMYPKLWEISGVSYSNLIDKIINFSIERFEQEKKTKKKL